MNQACLANILTIHRPSNVGGLSHLIPQPQPMDYDTLQRKIYQLETTESSEYYARIQMAVARGLALPA